MTLHANSQQLGVHFKPHENITKVASWLSEDDSQADQEDFSSRARDGTSEWFLESDEFQLWLNKKINVLFCPGISGAGKTVIASVVIHKLLTDFRGREAVKVTFVFCRGNHEKRGKADSLLRLILRQLIQHSQIVPKGVQDLYEEAKKSRAQPSPKKLEKTISSVIKSERLEVFFILDGLDEFEVHERGVLLKHLFKLQKDHQVRLLATAQPIQDIEERFDLGREDTRRREICPTAEAIRNYVAGEVNSVVGKEVADRPGLVDDIKDTIAQAADGM